MSENLTLRKQVRVRSDEMDMFNKMYPDCFARFIRFCIQRAIIDPQWFNDVFFSNIKGD